MDDEIDGEVLAFLGFDEEFEDDDSDEVLLASGFQEIDETENPYDLDDDS